VLVQTRREKPVEHGREFIAQERAARHPLQIIPPAVVVRPVDTAARERPLQPVEDRLVPDMHAQGHVRLASVAAEMALADQEADQEPEVEL